MLRGVGEGTSSQRTSMADAGALEGITLIVEKILRDASGQATLT